MLQYLYKLDYNLKLRNTLLKVQRESKSNEFQTELRFIHRKLVLLATLLRATISLETYAILTDLSFLKLYDSLGNVRNITEMDYIKIRNFAHTRLGMTDREFVGDPNKVYERYLNYYFKMIGA